MLSTLYETCWSSPNDRTVILSGDKTYDEKLRMIRGVATVGGRGISGEGGAGGHGLPTSISELNKVQQFQFQTSGILFFAGVQKLYAPEISGFCIVYVIIFGQFPGAFHFLSP